MNTLKSSVAALAIVVSSPTAGAAFAESAPPPPYVMTGANTVTIAGTCLGA